MFSDTHIITILFKMMDTQTASWAFFTVISSITSIKTWFPLASFEPFVIKSRTIGDDCMWRHSEWYWFVVDGQIEELYGWVADDGLLEWLRYCCWRYILQPLKVVFLRTLKTEKCRHGMTPDFREVVHACIKSWLKSFSLKELVQGFWLLSGEENIFWNEYEVCWHHYGKWETRF